METPQIIGTQSSPISDRFLLVESSPPCLQLFQEMHLLKNLRFFVRHTNQPLNGFRANTIAFSTETVSYSEHRFIFRFKKIGMSRRRLWKRAVAFLEGYFSQNSAEEKGTFETSCILIFWSMTNISNNLKGLLLGGKQDKINRKTFSENEAGAPTTAHDDRG